MSLSTLHFGTRKYAYPDIPVPKSVLVLFTFSFRVIDFSIDLFESLKQRVMNQLSTIQRYQAGRVILVNADAKLKVPLDLI